MEMLFQNITLTTLSKFDFEQSHVALQRFRTHFCDHFNMHLHMLEFTQIVECTAGGKRAFSVVSLGGELFLDFYSVARL